MLKYALMAVGAAILVAIVFVMLPTGNGPRPEPRILTSNDAQPTNGFVIHDAPPATAPIPAPPGAPAAGDASNLDVVMQRLRAGAAKPDATAAQSPDPSAAPAVPPPAITPAVPPPVVPPPAPASQWSSVTAQGTRWRMARSADGYVVSIDLGGGQVADVRVAPAFANLDPAAVNVRVDYLRDTIIQNFTRQSGAYTFARDGSVSIDR